MVHSNLKEYIEVDVKRLIKCATGCVFRADAAKMDRIDFHRFNGRRVQGAPQYRRNA